MTTGSAAQYEIGTFKATQHGTSHYCRPCVRRLHHFKLSLRLSMVLPSSRVWRRRGEILEVILQTLEEVAGLTKPPNKYDAVDGLVEGFKPAHLSLHELKDLFHNRHEDRPHIG